MTAEIIEISEPKEASPGATVNIKVTVRNKGNCVDHVGVLGLYSDGTVCEEVSITPLRECIRPGTHATFTVTFPITADDTEFLVQAWHGDAKDKVHDDSKVILVKSTGSSSRKALISQLTDILTTHSDFQQQQSTISGEFGRITKHSDFQQRQRTILRLFRRITKLRAQTEAEALSLWETRKKQIDTELDHTRKDATREQAKARQAVTDVKSALTSLRLQRMLEELKEKGKSESSTSDSTNASEELSHCSSLAVQTADQITAAVAEMTNWLMARNEKSNLGRATLLLILALPGFLLFLAGIARGSGILIFLGLMPPPLLIAAAHGIWDLGNRKPGNGFKANYLLLWLIAPVAPFVALVQILKDLPGGQTAISERV